MNITTQTPTEFKKYIKQAPIFSGQHHTAIGKIQVLMTHKGIHHASFEAQQTDKHYSDIDTLDTAKIILIGTPFQIKVWQAALQIPAGTTKTYQDLAQTIGHPKAHRAVATALARNNIAYFIPCHRIIRKDGQLGGYKWGIEKKLSLLNAEKIL